MHVSLIKKNKKESKSFVRVLQLTFVYIEKSVVKVDPCYYTDIVSLCAYYSDLHIF